MRVGKLVPESLASSTVLDREGRQILLDHSEPRDLPYLSLCATSVAFASVPRLRSFRHASSSSTN